jgi:hypothetical protein
LENDGSGSTLNASPALNVAAGDLIAAVASEWNVAGSFSISDGGSNSLTGLTQQTISTGFIVQTFYKIGAVANATATFTFTSPTSTYRNIIVLQFRPVNSGDTVTKSAGDSTNSGSTNACSTGNISFTVGANGTVAVAMVHLMYGTVEASNIDIATLAADGYTSLAGAGGKWLTFFYKVFNTSQSGINGSLNQGNSNTYNWVSNIVAFNDDPSGGAGTTLMPRAID